MKLLLSSDWHGDKFTMGVARFPEIKRAVRRSVEVAIAEKVDAYLFPGDLCDPDAGGVVFRCIELLLETAQVCRAHGIPFVAVAGNHDVIEDSSGDTTLTPLRAVGEDHWIYCFNQPGSFSIKGQRFLALPYTATSHAYDVSHVLQRELFDHPAPTVVVGHLSVPGVLPGEETTDMARGREVLLPLDEVIAHPRTKLVINGHYHRRQIEGKLVIPGSLARLTHNDEQNEPGFLVVTVE